LRGEGWGEGEYLPFHLLERVGVRVEKVRGSFPLTSVLSLGGERKIKVKGFHRRLLRRFASRNDQIDGQTE
jgi:hypothetical protein